MILKDNWRFRADGDTAFHKAEVPGTVFDDLLRNQLIPDPFYALNEQAVAWVEEKDWVYEAEFHLTPDDLSYPYAMLKLKWVDTFADVYINGSKVLTTDNMFFAHEADVREKLRVGDNTISLHFRSALSAVRETYEKYGINYPADNDHHAHHYSVYARKAPYHYGWDWGIRLVGCGILSPVELVFDKGIRIADIYVPTESVDGKEARILAQVALENATGETQSVRVVSECRYQGERVVREIRNTQLSVGKNPITLPMLIPHPKLWMPHGWGEPNRYDIHVEVLAGDEVLAVGDTSIGLRTLVFHNEADSIGRNFYFEVNGHPLFAKGANYIPMDINLSRVTPQDYERLFDDMKKANMNMVRVWGGGVYEQDLFYDLADRNGILVWQDFMFACTTYPADSALLENIRREAEYNVKRLRNHPSLALWCGNNEIYEGIKYWGWNKRYTPSQYEKMKKDYDEIFRHLLPSCVARYDVARSYIHTSPDSANWGRPHTQTMGDIHYWGIWYGDESFDAMDSLPLRFVSEYGFESFPEMKTVKTFAPPAEWRIDSDVMKHRQRSSIGNERIMETMARYYRMPTDFADFVYVSQLLQGHGIARCIESNRRNRPVCMGSLYWQLNDSWPAISWSAIDYYKNKKALYYLSGKAFSPVMVSLFQKGGMMDVYVISDRLTALEDAVVEISVEGFDGITQQVVRFPCDVQANCSEKIASLPVGDIVPLDLEKKCSLVTRITDREGHVAFEGRDFLVRPKELELPCPDIRYEVKKSEGALYVTIHTANFAKDVFIEVPLLGANYTDNFFDLSAGTTKTVCITGEGIETMDTSQIRIKTLVDTYK